ncbi:hypothetical protein AB0C47_06080 [Micromonospora taraxaci]|uniref:hypothetical protein n=1 Tax=Micromonospora taraxaci TaxID=1316803 RepID=UPI0033FAAB98
MMNFDPIVMAMVGCVQMLDTAESHEVDSSFAVKVQEMMGEYLAEIPRADEPELRAMLLRMAGEISVREPEIAKHLTRWAGNLSVS